MKINITKLLDEYNQGKSITKDEEGNVILGEEFKKAYKQRCDDAGIIPAIDFEIYKSTSEFKSTICYNLLKDISRFSR